jgi:hypothetical protein
MPFIHCLPYSLKLYKFGKVYHYFSEKSKKKLLNGILAPMALYKD